MITEATRERFGARAERLRGEGRAGGRWLVLTHDNPDPDALASAILLSTVLRRAFKQRATAAYGGIVGRAENRAMRTYLNITLVPVSEIRFADARSLIDSSRPTRVMTASRSATHIAAASSVRVSSPSGNTICL